MANRHLHIGIVWNGPSKFEQVQSLIDKVSNVEWMRYGGNCWIIYTSHTPTQWADYIRPHLNSTDQLVIYEVTNLGQADGWLPEKIWDWLKAFRY